MERVLHWLLALLAICSVARGIDGKCAACYSVAKEIERGISNEKPRNHLDLRYRLDSKGQRVGKVIDYRVSELKVVELLDGLCEKMQGYTLEKVDSEQQHWIKVDSWDNLTNKLDTWHTKKIYHLTAEGEIRIYLTPRLPFCNLDVITSFLCTSDRLLEETEDNLTELMKKGSVEVGDVRKVLCEDLSKHCSQTRRGTEEVKSDASEDRNEL